MRDLSLVALLMTVAAIAAMPVAREVPRFLILGTALLAVGGLVSKFVPGSWAPLLALPGAVVISFGTGVPGPPWVTWLIAGMTAFASPLFNRFDRRYEVTGLSPLLWLLTVGGAFLTLPDTEEVLVMLGVAVPFLLLALIKIPLGFGIYPLVGLFLWIVAWGGRGREAAVVGAAACMGVFLAEPLGNFGDRKRLSTLFLLVVHVVLVLVGSRLAGFQVRTETAVAVSLLALALAFLICQQYVIRRMDPSHEHEI